MAFGGICFYQTVGFYELTNNDNIQMVSICTHIRVISRNLWVPLEFIDLKKLLMAPSLAYLHRHFILKVSVHLKN